jgi:hypothetical protein
VTLYPQGSGTRRLIANYNPLSYDASGDKPGDQGGQREEFQCRLEHFDFSRQEVDQIVERSGLGTRLPFAIVSLSLEVFAV